jgi:hypothetical protein
MEVTMITENTEQLLAAERALTQTLQSNMREMYNKGMIAGTEKILVDISKNLSTVAKDAKCPRHLRAGFAEASAYLESIVTGKTYTLKAQPERIKKVVAPVVKEKAKADLVAKAFDQNKKSVKPATATN